jgi:hypothetical protein
VPTLLELPVLLDELTSPPTEELLSPLPPLSEEHENVNAKASITPAATRIDFVLFILFLLLFYLPKNHPFLVYFSPLKI